MKPLELTISAFGPFADRVRIDFRPLQKQLFLITGDTGSGKTTIFDAFIYALYGITSQKDRPAGQMRSDFAKAETETYVELDFQAKGQNYRIRRRPAYSRPSLRGDGNTQVASQVELRLPDGTFLNRQEEVNRKVKELIGLDGGQFKQTSLLPQGDFKQLLAADADSREKVFRRIFNTDFIVAFQQNLNQASKAKKSDLEALEVELKQILTYIFWSDQLEATDCREILSHIIGGEMSLLNSGLTAFSQYCQELQTLGQGFKNRQQKLEGQRDEARLEYDQAKVISEAFFQLEEKEADLGRLAQKEADFIQRATRLELKKYVLLNIAGHYKEWQTLKDELGLEGARAENLSVSARELEKELGQLKTDLVGAKACEPDLDREQIALAKLEADFRSYREIVTREKSVAEATRAKNKAAQDLAKLRDRLKLIVDREDELEGLVQEAQSTAVSQAELGQRLAAIKQDMGAREKICEAWRQGREDQDRLAEIKEKIRTTVLEVEDLKQDLRAGERAEAAALLARDLAPGQPCPVCGQTHHLKKAELPGYSAEKLASLKDSLNEKMTYLSELTTDQARLDERLSQANNSITDYLKSQTKMPSQALEKALDKENQTFNFNDLPAFQAFQAATDELFETSRKLKAELEEQEGKLQGQADLTKSVEEIRRSKEKIENHLVGAEEAYENSLIAENSLVASLKQARQDLSFQDYEDAQADYESRQKAYVEARARLKDLEEKVKALEIKQGKLESRLDQVKENIADHERRASQLTDQIATAAEVKDLDVTNLDSYISDPADLDREEREIKAFLEKVGQVRLETEKLKKQTKGKVKPDLNKLGQKLSEAEEDLADQTKEIHRLDIMLSRNQELLVELSDKVDHYQQTAHLEARLSRLSSLASGQSGKGKRTFEAFVQSYYFDRMLEASNSRLKKMTNHRYYLDRSREVTDRRKRAGLEFNIFDAYTGKYRPAATLSGGESFKAALALALGLSDTVQQMQGGVAIETLFIDEGFGSLDQESLEQAVRVLAEISDGDHMIGIISHVAELKERIDLKIELVTGANGSKIRFVD